MNNTTFTKTDHHHVFAVQDWGHGKKGSTITCGFSRDLARSVADDIIDRRGDDVEMWDALWIFHCNGGCHWDDDHDWVELTEPYWTAS